ncbi:DUF3168 domain-containing protein [Streptomyces thermoviolaceus]|uniref:DUF3168 domain-containing protein n=1 Tax=Streptomyces thermoviolaceus TaxID=1952 RepID=UPI00167C3A21|nr:DUF3168 domain-containing protein [Streptomyces thermoviolaceus]GGV80488.1 hypothetical protein GCM10010499_43540 [Streptomyces thermoviolaceus subsp. apingens]
MATALWPLQQAVYAKLTADTTLMGLVSGVYDEVPEDVEFPYVTLGSITELPDDAHDRQGLTAQVVLHIWSKYHGYREAAEILAAMDQVLDRKPLAVDGFTDISIAQAQHQSMRDSDPTIRHINVQYRVWMTVQTEEKES